MANSEAKQSNSIYYNIDIYNDNSTNGDISSKFSTAFNTPLLMDTSNYEVAVARARIPLDQIPLSQENIPFQKWQIEIGVPSTMSLNDYTYYSSYVPQFLPNLSPYSLNTALVGLLNAGGVSTITIDSVASPSSGNVQVVYGTSPILMSQEILTGVDVNNTISNLAFAKNFGYYVDSTYDPVIYQCSYAGGPPTDSFNVNYIPGFPGYPGGNTRIIGVCADQTRDNDNVYMLLYNTDSGSWYIYELFSATGYILPTLGGIPLLQHNPIYSMSCDDNYLTLSCGFFNEPPNTGYVTFIFDISGPITLYRQFNNMNAYTSFIDYSDGNYYTAPIYEPNLTFYQGSMLNNSQLVIYNPPNPNAIFVRFLGTDTWNNLLVCFKDTITLTYSIVAYNKNLAGNSIYTIQMGNENPVTLAKFTSVSGVNTLPSLSPNYQVMTINDYLRQINMGFVDVFSQIPQPYSSPTIAPRLVYDSATSIVSIVCDPGCPSSLTNACVINFNQLLWSLFKFNSIAAVYTALPPIGGKVRTLTIDDVASGATLSITPQPNSTLYRFSDLTRIIIGTTRMGVYGDNQNNDKLLVNIGDFTVDTENGIPNLIIYNPFILRFYKLYQNTPLTNIDVFVSYANRAGEVFPITISPYNSIGLKLEFQKIPMTIQ